jgi:hypothetical protein
MKKIKKHTVTPESKKITRKEAIKKTGITALTAASILFLSTKDSAAASSLPTNPGNGW